MGPVSSSVRRVATLWVLILGIGLSGSVVASDVATCAPVDVRLVEEGNWPPFTLDLEGVASRGLSYDLMQLIFGHLQRCAEITLLPQARMLSMVRKGRADGVTVISKNPDRETYLAYTESPLLVRLLPS